MAIGFARAFPSHRSFGACCVWNEPTEHLGLWQAIERINREDSKVVLGHAGKKEEDDELTPRTPPRHLSCWWCWLRCSWRSSARCSRGSHSVSKEGSGGGREPTTSSQTLSKQELPQVSLSLLELTAECRTKAPGALQTLISPGWKLFKFLSVVGGRCGNLPSFLEPSSPNTLDSMHSPWEYIEAAERTSWRSLLHKR